jgi:hypothetical protein
VHLPGAGCDGRPPAAPDLFCNLLGKMKTLSMYQILMHDNVEGRYAIS